MHYIQRLIQTHQKMILKSVCVHFAHGSNKRSFPLEYSIEIPLKCMIVALSMLQIAGITFSEVCAACAYLHDSRAIITHPINNRRDSELSRCSLFRASLTNFLYCIWTGMALELNLLEVGGTCMLTSFSIVSFSLLDVLLLFVGTVIFWRILRPIGSCCRVC